QRTEAHVLRKLWASAQAEGARRAPDAGHRHAEGAAAALGRGFGVVARRELRAALAALGASARAEDARPLRVGLLGAVLLGAVLFGGGAELRAAEGAEPPLWRPAICA